MAIAFFLAVQTGCQDSPATAELVYESPRLRVAVEEGKQLCGGSVARMETFLDSVESRYGLSTETQLDFFLLHEVDELCGTEAIGCASDATVVSEWAPHLHELAHLVSPGTAAAVLEEGFATMLGDGMAWSIANQRAAEAITGDRTGPLPIELYVSAGQLAQSIEVDFGKAALVSLLRETDPDTSAQDLALLFETLTGAELSAYAEQLDQVECSEAAVSWMIPSCDAAPVHDLRDGPFVWTPHQDCSSDEALGEWRGSYWVEQAIRVPVDDVQGWMQVHADFAPEVQLRIDRCGSCDEWQLRPTDFEQSSDSVHPGTWLVRAFAPLGTPIEGSLEVEYVGGWSLP